jgi:predicted AAA+ superfamily ATPase
MRTLSLYESGDSDGHVSLSKLFNGIKPEGTLSSLDYSKAVNLICRGGWPKAVGMDDTRAHEIPRSYVKMTLENDISKVDGRKRNSALAKKLLWSIARNTATSASIKTLADDIGEKGRRPSDPTVESYLGALKKLYLVEEQSGWDPNIRSKVRIQSSPRRHLTDPSIAAHLLCGGPGELRQDPNTAGFLFESMCHRDLCVYASAIGGEVFYYRDDDGLEVDFVIQLSDGRWGMAEAKLGTYEFEKAARNLLKVKEKMITAGSREPSFMIILNATGGVVHTGPDGITEVPMDRFGP